MQTFYLQPSIICLLDVPEGGKQTPVLPASSSKFDEACRHITATERKNIARITLQLECESTPKNGHGLACGMCMQSHPS